MRRFELDGDVWDIAQLGKQLEITSAGKTAIRKFVSDDHARVQYDKLIAARLAAGYREIETAVAPAVVEPPPSADVNPELERAILDDPNDTQAYQVYADWLDRQGDPRGELIALQVAQSANPRDADIKKAIKKLFARHTERLLGPLEPFERAFEWRHGFIHHVKLDDDDDESPSDVIEQVIAHPSGRFLAELTIRDDHYAHLDELIELLCRTPLRALRSFELATRVGLEGLGALWVAMPRLRRLCLKGRHPSSQLRRATVQSIATAAWPVLEKLELRFVRTAMNDGSPPPVNEQAARAEDLEPLIKRTDLPALTHLRLRDAVFGDALCAMIVASPLASQLQVLDLGMCNISAVGVQSLYANAARFTKLRELWLRSLSASHNRAGLANVFKRLVESDSDLDDRHDGYDDRYGSIRE